MAKVSELKERGRALEQQGAYDKALAVYRHILTHLERTPAIRDELALYVKVGDLSLKLGDPTTAVSMYERAAEQYAHVGSERHVIALCLKLLRVAPDRWDLFRVSVERLLEHGHVHAAHAVLTDYARRATLPHIVVGLQPSAGGAEEEVRVGVRAMLAELDRTPPATPPDERSAAASDEVLEVTRDVSPGPTAAVIPTPPASPALPERPPAPRPLPPQVHAPPPASVQPRPAPPAPPPARTPPPVREAPRRPAPPVPPRHPVRARPEQGRAVGKVFLGAERRRRDRRPALAIGTVVVIALAALGAYALGLLPFGGSERGGASGRRGEGPRTTMPGAAAPADTPRAAAAVPPDSVMPAPVPETVPTAVAVPAAESLPAGGGAAPVTVPIAPGDALPVDAVIVSGAPIVSVTQIPAGSRPAFRVVQRLPSGQTITLNLLPVAAGADTVGVTEPRVSAVGADSSSASVRFWGYLVNARAPVTPDTLAALLRRLVRAEPAR